MGRACFGCLVVHRDGSVAFCTEELEGRPCAGYGVRHEGGTMACRVVPRLVRCRYCEQALQLRIVFAGRFEPELPEPSPARVN